jgi:site-specific recombinase XerC
VPVVSPVNLYLLQQAEGSRANVRRRLDAVARLLNPTAEAISYDWSSVDFAQVATVKGALGQTMKWTSANAYLAALKGVVRTAWQVGMMTTDQYQRAVSVPMYTGAVVPAGRHIAGDEFARLFSALATDKTPRGLRDLALFAIARATGARRTEMTNIDVEHLNLQDMTVRVFGKGRRERESALSEWVRAPLVAWLGVRGTVSGALFVRLGRRGQPLVNPPRRLSSSGMQDILERRQAEFNLAHFTWHDFRRSLVTDLLDDGYDLEAAGKQVGHTNPKTTMRYSRRDARKLQQVARAIPSPFSGSDAK